MRLVYAGVAIAMALAGPIATVASGGVAVHKQRIEIDEVFPPRDATATFVLYPLPPTAGDPHPPGRFVETPPGSKDSAADKGTVTVLVSHDRIARNERVFVAAREELIGRRGTLRLSVRFDVYDIPSNGARVFLGTWKIMAGTGAYSGLRGGGRYVGGVWPGGRGDRRLDGWVTR